MIMDALSKDNSPDSAKSQWLKTTTKKLRSHSIGHDWKRKDVDEL